MNHVSYLAAPGLIVSYKAHQLPGLVLQETCAHLGVTPELVLSSDRRRPYVEARMIVTYLLRKMSGMTHHDISTFLGGRHHSTSINTIQQCQNLLATDPEFEKKVQAVRRML
jgi:chromosomal replication initiator protein